MRAAHQPIDVALEHLVERRGTAGHEGGADDRVHQQRDVGRPEGPEMEPDERRDQDEQVDPRLGEREEVAPTRVVGTATAVMVGTVRCGPCIGTDGQLSAGPVSASTSTDSYWILPAGLANLAQHAVLHPVRVPPLDRVHGVAVHEHREMQVVAAGEPGHAAAAERLRPCAPCRPA